MQFGKSIKNNKRDKMKRLVYSLLLVTVFCFAEAFEGEQKKADCLLLQDENSIICKYEHERMEEDVEISVHWISPNGETSRERLMIIPAGHGSIYDFRYIEGRAKGTWSFIVKEGDVETTTTFVVE
ncbi:hypothetical protein CRV08_02625 [Halarcobacter ebronensis]|uniref:DUF2914 domain-containing protein n=2 Tax=Halarcobacter ebronensis TaxID=1462615 RepID=A0A4Q0YG95_9BACT|nr:hypothetical protein CRV08_02625 [Halarcobacter ebronensis]